MKYEFHVGDYVETKDGAVGFITEVGITCAIPYFTWIASDGGKSCQRMYIKSAEEVAPILSNRYKRIGKYDFAKMRYPDTPVKPEQSKEIERLPDEYEKEFTFFRTETEPEKQDMFYLINLGTLSAKINELVDAVNELRKAE